MIKQNSPMWASPQLMRTLPTTLPSATILGTETQAYNSQLYEHITKTASDCMFKLTRVNSSWIKALLLHLIILLFDSFVVTPAKRI